MGPTNPAEEHFRRGLWGWATSTWVKLIATAGGILKVHVAEQTGFLTVRQTVASYLVNSGYGWTGSAWRKLPMLWGYSSHFAESVTGTASGAGDAATSTTAVSAGEVFVLQHITATHSAATAKVLYSTVDVGAVSMAMSHELSAIPGLTYFWSGSLLLPEGAQVKAGVVSPGDGKQVVLTVWGYKMSIAEA